MDVHIDDSGNAGRVELRLSVDEVRNLVDGLNDLLTSTSDSPGFYTGSSDGRVTVVHRVSGAA